MEDGKLFAYAIYFIAGCLGTVIFFWIGKYVLGIDSLLDELRELRKMLGDKTENKEQ